MLKQIIIALLLLSQIAATRPYNTYIFSNYVPLQVGQFVLVKGGKWNGNYGFIQFVYPNNYYGVDLDRSHTPTIIPRQYLFLIDVSSKPY